MAMKTFAVNTHKRTEFVDITAEVAKTVTGMGVKDGVVTVFCPHTTGGLTINESWLRVTDGSQCGAGRGGREV